MSCVIYKLRLLPQKHKRIDSVETSSLSYCSFPLDSSARRKKPQKMYITRQIVVRVKTVRQ